MKLLTKRFIFWAIFLLSCLVTVVPAIAQWGYISGMVTDLYSGAPIDGAKIKADGTSTTSTTSGDYILILPPGTYTVSASAQSS